MEILNEFGIKQVLYSSPSDPSDTETGHAILFLAY